MSSTPQTAGPNIDSILTETRSFPPPPEFSKNAHIKSKEEYDKICARAAADPEAFWADIARDLHWFKPWDKVLEWDLPWAKWFVGGKINLSYNCLDRHSRDLAQEQGRHSSGRVNPAKCTHPHLPAIADRSQEVCQRAQVARHEIGRSRRHLHGHVSRTAHRHAGLRPHRRTALGHLRRILRQRAGRSHQPIRKRSPWSRRMDPIAAAGK